MRRSPDCQNHRRGRRLWPRRRTAPGGGGEAGADFARGPRGGGHRSSLQEAAFFEKRISALRTGALWGILSSITRRVHPAEGGIEVKIYNGEPIQAKAGPGEGAYLTARYQLQAEGPTLITVGRGEEAWTPLACKEVYGKAVKTALELKCGSCLFDLAPAGSWAWPACAPPWRGSAAEATSRSLPCPAAGSRSSPATPAARAGGRRTSPRPWSWPAPSWRPGIW